MSATRFGKRLAAALLAILSGCASVSAWERGELADPIMIFDENPVDAGIHDQHHDYREGSTGGTRAPRGGCGCG